MGENKSHVQTHHHYPSSSRLSQRNNKSTGTNSNRTIGGEIVEVQGGHIVRSIGQKDRHSKVCTTKGPRDRRVRLAAHTAIQFYDVQDRLGYDRPSKAVDWLIKKAKAAIDDLAQLPPWRPIGCDNDGNEHEEPGMKKKIIGDSHEQEEQVGLDVDGLVVQRASSFMLGNDEKVDKSNFNVKDSSFLPTKLDSDSIADTMKSFFPMGDSAECSSSSDIMQFHNFLTHDLVSKSGGHRQDLNLSFQDPISMNNHSIQQTMQHHINSQAHHVLLSGTPLGYDGNSFTFLDQNQERLQSWNNNNASVDLFDSQTVSQPMLQQLLGQNQFFTTQRGPLQSSNNTPSVQAWIDQIAIIDHNNQHHQGSIVPLYPPSSFSGIGFASGINGYAGFCHIPAQIRGDDEEEHNNNNGYSDKPSSTSSDSHHH